MKKTDRPEIEDEIARNLQRAFQERAEADVPSRFLDLLAQLRAQEEDAPADSNGVRHDQ